jgi:hypothetical protein
VLVVSTAGIEPRRKGPPRNALDILTRTIDLLSGQPRPAELQQGELAALERRWLEYNVCKERLEPLLKTAREDVLAFCRRDAFFPPSTAPFAAAVPWLGANYFPEIAPSWRTATVFRPETEIATSEGYSFDPVVMRALFELGAATFQDRCSEILNVLGIGGRVALAACKRSGPEVIDEARRLYAPLEGCRKGVDEVATCKEVRRCD